MLQISLLSLASLILSSLFRMLSASLFCFSLSLVLYWGTTLIKPSSPLKPTSSSYHDRPHSRSASNSSTDTTDSTASNTYSDSSSDAISSKLDTAPPNFLQFFSSTSYSVMVFIASRLSISLEGAPASASNFPSPSSSFLPPPTPGAHEFAIKPPAGKKQSLSKLDKEGVKRVSGGEVNGSAVTVESTAPPVTVNGATPNGVLNTAISVPLPTSPLPTTPSTPTPGSVLVHRRSLQNGTLNNGMSSSHLEPPVSPAPYACSSTSASATPTISQAKLPAEYDEPAELTVDTNVPTSVGPPSRPLSTSLDPSLFSNRPAPPSPALSASGRRLSRALSSSSSRGGGSASRPTSMMGISVSRANSLRNKDGRGGMGSPREMGAFALPSPIALDGSGFPGVGTPTTATMKRMSTLSTTSIEEREEDDDAPRSAILIPQVPVGAESCVVGNSGSGAVVVTSPVGEVTKRPPKHYIKIRDFGFAKGDDRHVGMGVDVPKANRVERVNRKLAMAPGVRAKRRESEMSWGSGGG
ncbi:hypothetical protein CVT24_001044, partial [Panaeolus cyanescens]